MHRLAHLLAVCLLLLCSVAAQTVAGKWTGHIAVPGDKLDVVVTLAEAGGTWRGTIDIPAQQAEDLPLRDVVVRGHDVTFAIADLAGEPTFRGTLAADGKTIAGSFTQGGQQLTFSLQPAAQAAAQARARFDDLPAWLDETRAMFEVPGVAVAVIQGGDVVATFASGHRDVGKQWPADADTLFAIGSCTKAFTTCLLAMLVDDGVLDWDLPVRRWLPEFALADAPLGERLTPRDLVTHRSGMPRHDLVWYGATFERAAMVQRLRHLPMNHDLRTDFQYNNLMFLCAGHLAERLGAASWEQLVQKRILTPLGMTRTNLTVGAMQQDDNHALPYRKHAGAVGAIPFRDITAIGPAGSINSSVREMAQWVALQLQGGTNGDRRLLSATMAADLHVVRMPAGDPPGTGDATVLDIGYALGWFVDVYRGHRRVHHGGNIDGFSALVALLPDAGYGFVVLCNLDATPLPELVVRTLADRALGLDVHDTRATLLGKLQLAERTGKTAKQAAEALRHTGTQPSRPLAEYVGRYTHPGYGDCSIEPTASGLRVDLHGLVCDLEHWHHDVFVGAEGKGEPALAGTRLQFLLDFDGEVEGLRTMLEPSVAPLLFTRGADPRFGEPAFLQQLAGDYELDTGTATIVAQGGRLLVTLPGQRHELEPARGLRCRLRGLSGYSLEFLLDANGRPTGLRFRQPEGVYTARRQG